MKIKENIQLKVAVLKLQGKLMGPPETEELEKHVDHLIKEGLKLFVFDMKNVRWLNSMGMGAIIKCLKKIQAIEGHLMLAELSPKINSIMSISQMNRVFKTKNTVKEAVNELNNI
ncbi:STAS domain-containing protein [Caldithrix abyssi]|uniref:Anti-anti-sigma regulatory factor, SpoIIAA n=1 Tax=Caldithrix abyssi DSM 13497 TaxID=880073 RepID=H1XPJ0_CALAY|nr:STAS domain-containing protein [Caldithrix abyssi]APF19472.1 anti-anti-sigma regulatory factor, SpoIIAA [Caldithrix abyssi DSM 13497]EHO43361.1 Sulfate transporter/antisigma-factor antagonist STAS [Caldithrix abyssi DSM 13497]